MMRANPKCKNPEVAKVSASRMLTYPHVQERIQELLDARQNDLQITAERVLKELARIAFANIADAIEMVDGEIKVKDLKRMHRNIRSAISEITIDEVDLPKQGVKRTTKIKMHSKVAALKELVAYLGLTNDFNVAVQTLQKYGLKVQRNPDVESNWEVVNLEKN